MLGPTSNSCHTRGRASQPPCQRGVRDGCRLRRGREVGHYDDTGRVLHGRGSGQPWRRAKLHRPGGNLTGVATLSSAVLAKRLELLRELAPRAEVFAALINPKNPSAE